MPIRLTRAASPEEWRAARRLIEEYVASLGVDLSFQNIDRELAQLAAEYSAPAGAFLLAQEGGSYVGCVGVRPFSPGTGEIKRLYVRPGARRGGAGRLLAEGIISAAKDLGYSHLLLDTLPEMHAAQRLYRALGFQPTEPYRFNPVPGTVFLKLSFVAPH
jgi:GNAT superfamily N-acetyltransferase